MGTTCLSRTAGLFSVTPPHALLSSHETFCLTMSENEFGHSASKQEKVAP